MSTPKIAVIGASGQVARALRDVADKRGTNLVCAGRETADICDASQIKRFLIETRPSIVVNAAAYTAVDKAQTDFETALSVNVEGSATVATFSKWMNIPLIHISTDYVFDGLKTTPYLEDDARKPLSVYGWSKSDGEDAVRAALAQHIIVRTAWVYSTFGSNFVKTMLRLGAERDVVRVIADQHGTPTSAEDLAGALLDVAQRVHLDSDAAPWGTYHLTGAGQTTWHGLAAEIFRLSAEAGHKVPRVEAITTAEYPLPAARPAYGVLDNAKIRTAFGIKLPPWQESLAVCVRQLQSRDYP